MSSIAAAIDRGDAARFVDALFLVYIILVIASVAISWYVSFRGSLPHKGALRAVTGFIEETTAPYLNLFRRFLPPLGGGGMAIDLSPMIGLILLFVARSVVVGLIEG
ncbi:MAG: YggT family protein [Thermoleophilia bacterium]|nr:YggT family protein [Thermoleophilia bacterium]